MVIQLTQKFSQLSLLLALCATVILYQAGLKGPFVFDDITNLLLNPAMINAAPDLASLKQASLSVQSGPVGRPLAMLSFALNHAFFGFEVFYYKLTNLIIHLLNGLGLYTLCLLLLRQYHQLSPSQVSTERQLQWVSLAVASIWLLHPLNLTSVLYVVQRMNSLATFFVLGGLISYTIGRRQLLQGKGIGFVLLSMGPLVCGILAVLSKENGALLPLYILAIELIFFRFAAPAHLARHFKVVFVCLYVIPIILGLILIAFDGERLLTLSRYQYYPFDLSERLMTQARVLWFYLYLIVVPDFTQMGLFHDDFVISRGILNPPSTLFSILGLAGLIGLAGALWRKAPLFAFGIAWFLIGHSLESSLIPLELVHEHRNYLPQFGIIFPLVYYLLHSRVNVLNKSGLRYAIVLVYLSLISFGTYTRVHFWSTEFDLYLSEITYHPDSIRANTSMAVLLHDNKNYGIAERFFTQAANIDELDASSMIRLIHHFDVANKEVPNDYLEELVYRLNKGIYRFHILLNFNNLLKTSTDNPGLNRKLAEIYEHYIDKEDIPAGPGRHRYVYEALADSYREIGDFAKAREILNRAIAIKPLSVYYIKLAEIEMDMGNIARAESTLNSIDLNEANLNPESKRRLEKLKSRMHQYHARDTKK